ncbi:MAG: TlpA disulfide reductase family protein [Bacteriovoracaceae bacterium]|nr:TlpA disulfide reductase family protein [Bacteriovoracaceae bacterium]
MNTIGRKSLAQHLFRNSIVIILIEILFSCSNPNKNVSDGISSKITSEVFKAASFIEEENNRSTTLGQILKSKINSADVIYVHFWATWCVPCLTELPKLVEYIDTTNKIGPKKNLLLLIAVDDSKEKTQQFLSKIKINKDYSVLLLDTEEEAYLKFGVSKVPETFTFNQNGQLMQKFIGPQNW